MNILDEITVSYDLDSKILCDTPAKLKLREKTLKGINFNLNDENSTIPALMLAKKKKKKNDRNEQVQEEVVVQDEVENNEYTKVDISDMNYVEVGNDFDDSRKLRVSQEKKEIFSEIGQELVDMISAAADLGYSKNSENEVEAVSVEEIPDAIDVTGIEIEEPVVEKVELPVEEPEVGYENIVETYSEEPGVESVVEEVVPEVSIRESNDEVATETEEVVKPVVEEDSKFNIEQGDEGIVASVESVVEDEVPVVEEEAVSEIPDVQDSKMDSPVLEQAMENDVFMENQKIIKEIRELEREGKEIDELLKMDIQKRDNLIKIGNELDLILAEQDAKIIELHETFDRIVLQQREENLKRRDNNKSINDEKNAKRVQVQEESSRYDAMNEEKSGIRDENDKEIMKYEQLIQSLVDFPGNSYEEETSYKKVA